MTKPIFFPHSYQEKHKNQTPDLTEAEDLAKKYNLEIQVRHNAPHLIVGNLALNLMAKKNLKAFNYLKEFFKRANKEEKEIKIEDEIQR